VLRTALKPRWLALLALALVAATGMAFLGQWQLDRARANSRVNEIRAATSRPAVPLTSLLAPRQSFTNADADRPVTASGRWDAGHQLLVADRYLNGRHGWWVLAPLVLDDGSAVAVVRGWVASAGDPAADVGNVPTGTVRVSGVLRPGEPPIDREPGAGTGLPAGQLDGVDLTQLVQLWPQKLITGYLVLTDQQPVSSITSGLTPVPPTAPVNQTVAWQNLSYAVQWFAFAGFGLLMWWRLVRDDHLGRLRPQATAPSGSRDTARDTSRDPADADTAAGRVADTSVNDPASSTRGAHP
jgi:cytochrome oxidase assembly protein ShyY1